MTRQEWYRDIYLKSNHWKELRLKALARNKYTCEACLQRLPLDVHHLSYDRVGQETLDDLMILCRDCHNYIHDIWLKSLGQFDVRSLRIATIFVIRKHRGLPINKGYSKLNPKLRNLFKLARTS